MLHDEVVKRRKWLDEQRFLDLVGATNLIPGPNSTEMAIHVGFVRAGWVGLIVGGVCFILPAMLIVMALAWGYVRFGSAPEAGWLLYGIKPVMVAIVAQALWALGRRAVQTPLAGIVGLLALGSYLVGVNEIAVLLAGGLAVTAAKNLPGGKRPDMAGFWMPLAGVGLPALAATPFSPSLLFFIFLKIGAVLYGSGYVLLAFLRSDFVLRLGWLTEQQLVDAIAIGQVTPGPFFTTATFIGFLLGGVPAATVATIGIFLPAFVFVAISNPLIPRIRNSPWAGGFLDGVNVASLGLMAAVTWQLGRVSLIDPLTMGLALVALAVLVRFQCNATWLIVGGAIIGFFNVIVR